MSNAWGSLSSDCQGLRRWIPEIGVMRLSVSQNGRGQAGRVVSTWSLSAQAECVGAPRETPLHCRPNLKKGLYLALDLKKPPISADIEVITSFFLARTNVGA